MAVVSVPGFDPWVVGRQLFVPLMERLAQACDTPDDAYAAVQAEALDGLIFRLLPAPQALRLARLLAVVVDDMRAAALRRDPTDPTRRAEYLAELSLYLAGFLSDDTELDEDPAAAPDSG